MYEKSIEPLNKAVAEELSGVNQYMYFHFHCSDQGYDLLTNLFRKGVRMSKRFYETEASGGVTLKNVRKIAGTGVERISIGQITHSAPSINFKLDFIS